MNEAVDALRAGKPVILPTDTVYVDQKIIERMIPMIPTISRIQPIVWMFTPETLSVTAKARTAPTAARKIPTPRPMSSPFRSFSSRVVLP
jgi:hypothetical protein